MQTRDLIRAGGRRQRRERRDEISLGRPSRLRSAKDEFRFPRSRATSRDLGRLARCASGFIRRRKDRGETDRKLLPAEERARLPGEVEREREREREEGGRERSRATCAI
jgi:hypothetical protein